MPVAAGAWVAAAVGTALPTSYSVWAIAGGLVLAVWLRRARGRVVVVAGAGVGIVLAATSVVWHLHRLHSGEVARLAQRAASADVIVKLVRDPVPVGGLLIVDATARQVNVAGWHPVSTAVLVLAHDSGWSDLLPGQQVRVGARLEPPRQGDDVAAVLNVSGPPVLVGRPPWWQRAAGRARRSLRRACERLPTDARGLLPSLVDGDTSRVPADLETDMQTTGLSHLEAVSGENLGIVLGVVLLAMRGIGLRRRPRVVGAAVAVLGFVVLARPSPSVQRAAVMSAVTLLAMLTGRRTQARSTLAVAVTALVVMNPFLARSIGFVLSVSATAGIVALAPAWTRRLESRLPKPLALAVAVSAAAQLACTPALMLAFGGLTPYAVPANVVAAPAVVPATVLGVTAAVVAPASIAVARPLVWAAGIPTSAVAWTAHVFASFPGSATTLSRPLTIAVAVGAALVLARAVKRVGVSP